MFPLLHSPFTVGAEGLKISSIACGGSVFASLWTAVASALPLNWGGCVAAPFGFAGRGGRGGGGGGGAGGTARAHPSRARGAAPPPRGGPLPPEPRPYPHVPPS